MFVEGVKKFNKFYLLRIAHYFPGTVVGGLVLVLYRADMCIWGVREGGTMQPHTHSHTSSYRFRCLWDYYLHCDLIAYWLGLAKVICFYFQGQHLIFKKGIF